EMRSIRAVLPVDPRQKLLVEFLRRNAKVLLNRLCGCLELPEGVRHVQQLVGAPFLLDEIANAAGLKVGDDYLRRVGWKHETAIELGYGEQFLVSNRGKYLRRGAVFPFR